MNDKDMGDEWRELDRPTMIASLAALAYRSMTRGESSRVVGMGVASAALDWARDRELIPVIPEKDLLEFRTDSGMDARAAAATGSRERLLTFAGESFPMLLLVIEDLNEAVRVLVEASLDMAALNPKIKEQC